MHSLGVDIIEISRIEKTLERWGQRFMERIFTEAEINLTRSKPSSLASRFAAKEAVMKTLGTGVNGVSWREIEILSDDRGKPLVCLYGKARSRAGELGLSGLAVSLSDSREYAVAFVIGE
ncbi:MAG: holo-ACP synthase [Dehalococcoidales bacterium]|nr:holo-ACP synthase [Dehalococcoidales bacterium]